MNILRSAQVDQSYRYKSSIKSREASQIIEADIIEEDQLSVDDEIELEAEEEIVSEKENDDQEEAKIGSVVAIPAAAPQASITDKDFYKAMQKIKERGTGSKPPKKPASAYILFQKEKRAEILKRSPKAKVTEVVKEIAKCWRALNKE